MATYNLNNQPNLQDPISVSIYKHRDKLYKNILRFRAQSQNNGIFAEEIFRLCTDSINLNQLYKNHPHVDLAIVKEIPGVAEKNEIISVKSSIGKKPSLSAVLSDTKSVRLESSFSYILFADSNFELSYESGRIKLKQVLRDASKQISSSNNRDFKAMINLITYYCLKPNVDIQQFNTDLDTICNSPKESYIVDDQDKETRDYQLTYGSYNEYRIFVLRRIANLNAPISLGVLYTTEKDGNVSCIIKKTRAIKLNKYWEGLVDIWGKEVFKDGQKTKYLNKSQIEKLFGIEEEDFPVEIKIDLMDYQPEVQQQPQLTDRQRVERARELSNLKSYKLYVANKYRDADFGNKESDVADFVLKSVDILEQDPDKILKFKKFIDIIQNPPTLDRWW